MIFLSKLFMPCGKNWLREKDSNLRLPGYEPDGLTTDVSRVIKLQLFILEHRVGFKPTVLGICNPLHWVTLPPVHIPYIETHCTTCAG